ncbi:MAG TPA: hypothetical protein VHY84_01210 [Bryobacteraceae bacterium]|jgi:hypothetical protein|nr:hypothetical protein [Bryobacteraceae bacterium]
MNEDQRKILESVFESLDQAGAQLLDGVMNDVPEIHEARHAVTRARNTINGILERDHERNRS